jgi:hypothetical protein
VEKDMQRGGLSLTRDRMAEGMLHKPSPAIRPDAAAGTYTPAAQVKHIT